MALPTHPPIPEIQPGWTLARNIPVDLTDGIDSAIYELYGNGIHRGSTWRTERLSEVLFR